MLGFLFNVLSVALGIVLGALVIFALMINGKFIEWYTKKTMEMTNKIMKNLFKE